MGIGINPKMKDFILRNQNLIQKNEWKAILLGDILDSTTIQVGDLFSTIEYFCDLMRKAGIPIDNYFDQVFDSYEFKEPYKGIYFENQIENDTKKEYHYIGEENKFTYSDLYFMLVKFSNKGFDIMLLPDEDDLSGYISKDNFIMESKAFVNADNTYLVWYADFYKDKNRMFSLYWTEDLIGRVLPGYGYAYNMSEIDKLTKQVIDYLKNNNNGLIIK